MGDLLRFKDLPTWSRNKVPIKGRERTMLQPSEPGQRYRQAADLVSLRVVIARSQIRIEPTTLQARLADWEHTRRAPDVDIVILEWLASYVRATPMRRLDA